LLLSRREPPAERWWPECPWLDGDDVDEDVDVDVDDDDGLWVWWRER
jgi:hypothetical protein